MQMIINPGKQIDVMGAFYGNPLWNIEMQKVYKLVDMWLTQNK